MKILLDTQVIIWYFEINPFLPQKIEAIIDDLDNAIYISAISLWEISLKLNIKKLNLKFSLNELFAIIHNSRAIYIPLNDNHIRIYEELPLKKKHNDPFDRMLISTAIDQDLIFITSDKDIHRYKQVKCIWKKQINF